MDLIGGGGASVPSFGNVDLTPSLQQLGNKTANEFGKAGMITSTNETGAQAGNVLKVATQQAQENLNNAVTAAQDQNTANQQPSGLAELAGLFGL
jgi:hypothetical protein